MALVWDTRIEPLADGSFRVSAVEPRPATGAAEDGRALTVAEVANKLGMSRRLVIRLCNTGELAAYRQHVKIWLIPPAALRVYRMWRRGELSELDRARAMEEIRRRVG